MASVISVYSDFVSPNGGFILRAAVPRTRVRAAVRAISRWLPVTAFRLVLFVWNEHQIKTRNRVLASVLTLLLVDNGVKIFRRIFPRILQLEKLPFSEPLNANNRDFCFYATISRGLLVALLRANLHSAVTYKLPRKSFFPSFRARRMLPAAYYNVTVTFYAARNSDTARHRVYDGRHRHRFSPELPRAHLDKQALLPSSYSLATSVPTFVHTIGNGYGFLYTSAIYANH